MQRRKGEELIRQRFNNLLIALKDKKSGAEASLRGRLETETPIKKLREELTTLEGQNAKLEARIRELRDQIRNIEASVSQQVHEMTRDLDQTVTTMESRVRDQERTLVEQLWVDSLSADLKALLGKVPTAQELLNNGISESLKSLALPREE
jgi:predicted RNase H-like nuclease (RuvC/YqgF family)